MPESTNNALDQVEPSREHPLKTFFHQQNKASAYDASAEELIGDPLTAD